MVAGARAPGQRSLRRDTGGDGAVGPKLSGAIKSLSAAPQGDKPVTLGIGEPFTTTLGIALMFAFVLALPVLLYEVYGSCCRPSVPSSGGSRRR